MISYYGAQSYTILYACTKDLFRIHQSVARKSFSKHNPSRSAHIRRNISPFGEDTRRGEYAKHKFQKIRRLISAGAECCEAVTMGEERKTVDNCFSRTKSTKQGVGEASVSSDNQRLCDLTGQRACTMLCNLVCYSAGGRAELNAMLHSDQIRLIRTGLVVFF